MPEIEMSFEEWWQEVLEMCPTERSRIVVERCKNLYYDSWLSGLSPDDAYYNS